MCRSRLRCDESTSVENMLSIVLFQFTKRLKAWDALSRQFQAFTCCSKSI